MSVEGVDLSFARPGGAALAAAGKRFVMRYLEYSHASAGSSGKFLTRPEIDDYRGHGLAICFLFESTSTRALDGHAAGVADATDARVAMDGLGAPALPIYFAIDFDAQSAQQPIIDAYLAGAGSVLGKARVGVYGSYALCTRARASGTATWFYQTYAWSAGHIASFGHVYQYHNGQQINGGAVDLDRALKANYGQWDPAGGAGPVDPQPTEDPVIYQDGPIQTAIVSKGTAWRMSPSGTTGQHGFSDGGRYVVLGYSADKAFAECSGYVTTGGKLAGCLWASTGALSAFAPLAPTTDCSAAVAAAIAPLNARIAAAKTALG